MFPGAREGVCRAPNPSDASVRKDGWTAEASALHASALLPRRATSRIVQGNQSLERARIQKLLRPSLPALQPAPEPALVLLAPQLHLARVDGGDWLLVEHDPGGRAAIPGSGERWRRTGRRRVRSAALAALVAAAGVDDAAHDEREGLLDVDHVAGGGLHEAASAGLGPGEALRRLDLALALQVALVAGDDLDGGDAARVRSLLLLHRDQLVEVAQRFQRRAVGDVVHQQERVAAQVRRRPQPPVLFLARCVRQVEVVGSAVDGARHRVGVFCELVSADSRRCLRIGDF